MMPGKPTYWRHSRTLLLWCGVGALINPLVWPGTAYGASVRQAPGELACPASDSVRHAALGVDFGGRELPDADAGRTAVAITQALELGPLPPRARPGPGSVVLDRNPTPFLISIVPTDVSGIVSYAPVATARFKGPDRAEIRVSDRATPDLIRQAVVARVGELAVIVRDRAADVRNDVTSGLVEGLLTTARPDADMPLSPRDVGRVRALQAVADSLGHQPVAQSRQGADALGAALALGLLDQDPERSPHTMPGDAPLAGRLADQARQHAVRDLDADARNGLDEVLKLAQEPEGEVVLKALRDQRECQREVLREAARQASVVQTGADDLLTRTLKARRLPVLRRVIVGGGWAATVDYLTLDPPMPDRWVKGIPPVLAIADGSGTVNQLGDFRLTQPPMDMELPGAPFQPVEFAADRNDFLFSSAFDLAVATSRAVAGMPTYRASVAGIEARGTAPDAGSWPAAASYQLTTRDGRKIYAQAVDVATGLGSARIPEADGPLAGHTYTDPDSGYQVSFDDAGKPRILDPRGRPATRLPKLTGWLLGVQLLDGQASLIAGRKPFLLDGQGRPTERTVVDPASGDFVDPETRQPFDPSGSRIDPSLLDGSVRRTLGFRPDGSYRDPRFVADPGSGLSVNPMTDAVIKTGSGAPVAQRFLPLGVRDRLAALVRAHRVQYGGQNTSASYGPDDAVYVVGGGAGGASEVEQATGVRRTVTWGAKVPSKMPLTFPRGPEGGIDPEEMGRRYYDPQTPADEKELLKRDLSFFTGGGFNRRNTAPDFAAFSPAIWNHTVRTTDLPVAVRYTTDGGFLTTDKAGRSRRFDRLVYTIGQDASYPGGAADLLSSFALQPATGPGVELDGLTDAAGTLRVLGAAGVARAVLDATIAPNLVVDVDKKIRTQADALPPDARGIQPSIRYHAGRIAELNRTVAAG